MIVFVDYTDLIVVQNWKVTNYIADPVSGNRNKKWLSTLPCFDNEKLPFIVSSGGVSYNLVNINSGKMTVMVHGTSDNRKGQQAFCFVKRGSSWVMHFCTRKLNDQNLYECNWYGFTLKQDLLDCIS